MRTQASTPWLPHDHTNINGPESISGSAASLRRIRSACTSKFHRGAGLEQSQVVTTIQVGQDDAVETGEDLVQADLDDVALLLQVVGQVAAGLAGMDDDDDGRLLPPVPARAIALLELVAEGDSDVELRMSYRRAWSSLMSTSSCISRSGSTTTTLWFCSWPNCPRMMSCQRVELMHTLP
jgi:hypothetical protein